jgi:CheY-like chemotaxis protein
MALRDVLETAGYSVEGAASSGEAMALLDAREFQLVLADLRTESEEAGTRVLAYARQKDYRPATALIASDVNEPQAPQPLTLRREDVSSLLVQMANLIGQRADRRMREALLRAS